MDAKRFGVRWLLFGVGLALAGCATAPTAFSDRLFFGRTLPGSGVEISDAQWNAFVAEVIVPRFPQGFTISHGAGHWRGDNGVDVSEPAMILEVVHPLGAEADRKLREIAAEYVRRFHQEAVMRVRSPADLSFERRP